MTIRSQAQVCCLGRFRDYSFMEVLLICEVRGKRLVPTAICVRYGNEIVHACTKVRDFV
jgi:hypothetical protein